jgi:hypothetical protein
MYIQQQHKQQQVLAPAPSPPAEEACEAVSASVVPVAAADAACRVVKQAAKPVAVAGGVEEQGEEPEQCLAGAGSRSTLSSSAAAAGCPEDTAAPKGLPATQEQPTQQHSSSHEGIRAEQSTNSEAGRCGGSATASPATQLEGGALAAAAPRSDVPLQHAQTQSLQPSEAGGSTSSDVPQQAASGTDTHAAQQQQPSGPRPQGAQGALQTLVFSPLRLGSALASPAGATPSPGSSSLQQQAFSPLRLGSAALLQVQSGAVSAAGAGICGAAAGTEASGFVKLLSEPAEQLQPASRRSSTQPDGDQQQQQQQASRRLSGQQRSPQPSRRSSLAQADDDGEDAGKPGCDGVQSQQQQSLQLNLQQLQQRQQQAFSPLRHGPVGSASAANSPAALASPAFDLPSPLHRGLMSPAASASSAAAGAGGGGGGPAVALSVTLEQLGSSNAAEAHATSQQRGISSLAVGLSAPARPQAATAAAFASGGLERRRSSASGGTRLVRMGDAADNDAAPAVVQALPGPLHVSMGFVNVAAGHGSTSAIAGPHAPLHTGLLLSPATRLSLGGASTGDDGGWSSSGRPSLAGSDAGPAAAAATGAAAVAERAVAAAAGRALDALMASWGSSVASSVAVSGGLRVPRLSLPPALHVPDAPVPNSGRGAASTTRRSAADTAPAGMSVAAQDVSGTDSLSGPTATEAPQDGPPQPERAGGGGSVSPSGLTQSPRQAVTGWPAPAIGKRHTGDAVAAAPAPAFAHVAGALSDSSDATSDDDSDEFSFGEPSPPLQRRQQQQRPRQPAPDAASSWLVSRVANAASGLTEFDDD